MHLTRAFRFSLVAAVAFLIFACHVNAQQGAIGPRNRITRVILDSDVVTLAGNTHPMALPEFDLGAIADETRLERMVLLLQPDATQQAALDALVEAQQKPGSSLFRQWLSPEEYGSRFGVSAGDLAQIIAWLQGHGFTVEPVSSSRRIIVFSGTASQVADAFHSEIHRYDVAGTTHLSNSQDPQIPRALAPVISGIVSLQDFRRNSGKTSVRKAGPSNLADPSGRTKPENTQGSTHYLFPVDFATIYDLNPQYAAGIKGSGASIAIVGRSNINLSDVASFRSYSGLPANQPQVILDGANPGLVSGDQDESTLDVEWSGGVAPAAAVKFVVAASTATTDGVDLSAQYIVNHKTATVMSTSYGSCEAEMGATEAAFYNSLWKQAAAEGISVLVASGDSGTAGCSSGSSSKGSKAGVNGLCSSPYATCVGGTEFNEGSGKYWATTNGAGQGSALSYIPERVWNESAEDSGSGLWSSGGGISEIYPQPAWQKGIPGANSDGMRAVPDVALSAASHDGYLICENGSWYVIAGTSAASPSFAGILALVVEKQAGVGQGDANPTLYAFVDAGTSPFHATPSGNNSVPGVTGFVATGAAYNLATGLGSVDANLLVNGWPKPASAKPGFTIKTSVASESLVQGKSASFTIAVTGTGGFTGSVSFSATTPSGISVTFSPVSVKAGASTAVTITAAKTAKVGPESFVITAVSGSGTSTNTETATMILTVLPAPTLKIEASAALLTITPGSSIDIEVTTTTAGAVSGPLALSLEGLPAGISASWRAPAFKAIGPGETVSTLTLKAGESALVNSGTLKIQASDDGLVAQTECVLTVSRGPISRVLPDAF